MKPEERTAMEKRKALVSLHIMLMCYSLSGVFSKLAAGQPFPSPGFCICYGGIIALLGLYALAWQQIIKRIPLTTAFANKAATTVWGLVWGTVIFHEKVTLGKLAGVALVVAGVILFSQTDGEVAES